MIVAGIALIVIAIFIRNGFIWTIGLLSLVLGLIALLLGATGHRVAGRRHFF